MGLAMARRARLMRCSAEPARVRRWRGFQHLCSSNLGHVDPSAPPRDVALPRIPLIVRLSRALACNVVMRHARTVQQVDQGERPEVQLILPIFSSDWGGRIKYSWASYLPELPVRAIGVAGADVAYRRWRPVARGSRTARGVINTKVAGAVTPARARNSPESPPMPARPLAVRDARSARRWGARRSPREAGAERGRGEELGGRDRSNRVIGAPATARGGSRTHLRAPSPHRRRRGSGHDGGRGASRRPRTSCRVR